LTEYDQLSVTAARPISEPSRGWVPARLRARPGPRLNDSLDGGWVASHLLLRVPATRPPSTTRSTGVGSLAPSIARVRACAREMACSLGPLTEAISRLHRRPRTTYAGSSSFGDLARAARSLDDGLRLGDEDAKRAAVFEIGRLVDRSARRRPQLILQGCAQEPFRPEVTAGSSDSLESPAWRCPSHDVRAAGTAGLLEFVATIDGVQRHA
jgi:hypothetical protein